MMVYFLVWTHGVSTLCHAQKMTELANSAFRLSKHLGTQLAEAGLGLLEDENQTG
jgi:hypothetical protein